jgi:GDP-L-fucose synthase
MKDVKTTKEDLTPCFHEGEIVFDAGKPDGTRQKLLDVSMMSGMGWRPGVALPEGIGLAYGDFLRD